MDAKTELRKFDCTHCQFERWHRVVEFDEGDKRFIVKICLNCVQVQIDKTEVPAMTLEEVVEEIRKGRR